MKNIFTFVLTIVSLVSYGQDTTYYDHDWKKVSFMSKAQYYEIIQRDQADTNKAIETTYFISGQIKMQKSYSVYKDKKLDGKLKEWYENGQIRRDIDYKDDKLNGRVLTYWDNGKPKRIDNFENDKLIDGKCINSDGKETIHYDYEKMPEFPGGINALTQYLIKEIRYPNKSRRKGIEGRVVVGFIVNKNGTMSDIKIVESVNDELDQEAMRVLNKIPKWKPGMIDGEAVRVAFNLPIKFTLN